MSLQEAIAILEGFISDRINQYTIQNILDICSQILTLVKLFGANLGNIALRLLGIENSISTIQTPGNLTLQSVIDAMPGTAPVVLPPTPPTGYGGPSLADIFDYTLPVFDWYDGETAYLYAAAITHAADHANVLALGEGYRHPANPDFAYCDFTAQQAAEDLWATPPTSHVTPPPAVDWAAWNGTDALVTFLASQMSGWTWTTVGPLGVSTPGYAWSQAPSPNTGWWRCLVGEWQLPDRSGVARIAPKKAEDYAVLNIAVGLAALFATGGGDVSAIVTEVGTLLADALDLPTALGSLMTWLAGRSESTNQQQSTALTTLTGDVTTLTDSGTHTLQTVLDAVAALTAPDNADIATIKSEVEAMQADVTYIRNHLPTVHPTVPTWPGLSGVTLGTPVALVDQLVVDGPLDGVLVEVTVAPRGASSWHIGGQDMFYSWGEIAFGTDNGDLEPFQWLGAGNAVYLPRSIISPAHAVFHVRRDATGTVTPFTVD
jgi:hypothetical protein